MKNLGGRGIILHYSLRSSDLSIRELKQVRGYCNGYKNDYQLQKSRQDMLHKQEIHTAAAAQFPLSRKHHLGWGARNDSEDTEVSEFTHLTRFSFLT